MATFNDYMNDKLKKENVDLGYRIRKLTSNEYVGEFISCLIFEKAESEVQE